MTKGGGGTRESNACIPRSFRRGLFPPCSNLAFLAFITSEARPHLGPAAERSAYGHITSGQWRQNINVRPFLICNRF